MLVFDGSDQQALRWFAGNDGGAALATGKNPLALIQAQPVLLFGRAVAFVTLLYQNGANTLFEEVQTRGGGLCHLACGANGRDRQQTKNGGESSHLRHRQRRERAQGNS